MVASSNGGVIASGGLLVKQLLDLNPPFALTKPMVDGDKHGIRLLYSYGMLQVVNVLHMALFFEGHITRKT